jgi:hypothetical protein
MPFRGLTDTDIPFWYSVIRYRSMSPAILTNCEYNYRYLTSVLNIDDADPGFTQVLF